VSSANTTSALGQGLVDRVSHAAVAQATQVVRAPGQHDDEAIGLGGDRRHGGGRNRLRGIALRDARAQQCGDEHGLHHTEHGGHPCSAHEDATLARRVISAM
jgi:hypothetical protein